MHALGKDLSVLYGKKITGVSGLTSTTKMDMLLVFYRVCNASIKVVVASTSLSRSTREYRYTQGFVDGEAI